MQCNEYPLDELCLAFIGWVPRLYIQLTPMKKNENEHWAFVFCMKGAA